MPNFNDHESNQSQSRERRTTGSSGWQSSNDRRGGRNSSHQERSRSGYGRRDDDRRGGYGRNERAGGRDERRGFGYRSDNRGSYGRRDDDRRSGSYGRRDDDRRSGYGRRDDDRRGGFGRNERASGRDERRGFGHHSDSRGSYGRRDDDRRGSYERRDDDRRGFEHRADNRSGYGRRDDDRRGGFGRNERAGGRDERRSFEHRADNRGGYGRRDDDRRGGFARRDDDRRGSYGRRDDNQFARRDRRSSQRDDDGFRNLRGGEEKRQRAKELQYEIPESITADSLPSETRNHLRGLNSTNADIVARHLAYAGEMMDIDPEVAYQHAKAAYARAARIDIVREAVGISAYLTNRYSEALTELRAYRRFSNDYSPVALEADSERGLGRSEKALRFISEIPLNRLDAQSKVELAIVTSGAKADIGDFEGGLALVEKILVENLDQELASRVELVKADRLEELGRTEEAQKIRAQWEPIYVGDDEDTAMVLDLEDVLDEITEEQNSHASVTAYNENIDASDDKSDDESAEDSADDEHNKDADMPIAEELQHELGDDFDPEEWDEELRAHNSGQSLNSGADCDDSADFDGAEDFDGTDDCDDTDDFNSIDDFDADDFDKADDFDNTDDFDAEDFNEAHDGADTESAHSVCDIVDEEELIGEDEGEEC